MHNLKQITRNAIMEAYSYDIDPLKSELKECLNKSTKTVIAWSYIIKNIKENVNKEVIYTKICTRTSRSFLLLFDKETNSLYALINYRKYRQIKNVYDFQKYIQALLFKYNQYKIQPNLFSLCDNKAERNYNNIINELIGNFPDNIISEIASFNILTYYVEKDTLLSLSNYLLDYETLHVIHQENWMAETDSSALEITAGSEKVNSNEIKYDLSFTELSTEIQNQNNIVDVNIKNENKEESGNA